VLNIVKNIAFFIYIYLPFLKKQSYNKQHYIKLIVTAVSPQEGKGKEELN